MLLSYGVLLEQGYRTADMTLDRFKVTNLKENGIICETKFCKGSHVSFRCGHLIRKEPLRYLNLSSHAEERCWRWIQRYFKLGYEMTVEDKVKRAVHK